MVDLKFIRKYLLKLKYSLGNVAGDEFGVRQNLTRKRCGTLEDIVRFHVLPKGQKGNVSARPSGVTVKIYSVFCRNKWLGVFLFSLECYTSQSHGCA